MPHNARRYRPKQQAARENPPSTNAERDAEVFPQAGGFLRL
jgi:hypothetical protein